MWTLSVSRWMLLLTLTVVMLFVISKADASISLPCCTNVMSHEVKRFQKCHEQKPREGCNYHAFLIKNKKGLWCIDPAAQWLQDQIKNGLNCLPDLSLS